MNALKQKILTEGTAIGKDIVKVDSFLNHQLDIRFLEEIGKEFARRFEGVEQAYAIQAGRDPGLCFIPVFPRQIH